MLTAFALTKSGKKGKKSAPRSRVSLDKRGPHKCSAHHLGQTPVWLPHALTVLEKGTRLLDSDPGSALVFHICYLFQIYR
jgi:hypothetical protein